MLNFRTDEFSANDMKIATAPISTMSQQSRLSSWNDEVGLRKLLENSRHPIQVMELRGPTISLGLR
jgi:hypothetical protein